jgi:hypothetical protein
MPKKKKAKKNPGDKKRKAEAAKSQPVRKGKGKR